MDMNEIHDYARRLLEAHGERAGLEAAQKEQPNTSEVAIRTN